MLHLVRLLRIKNDWENYVIAIPISFLTLFSVYLTVLRLQSAILEQRMKEIRVEM